MSQKQKTNLSFVQRGINLPGLLFLWLEDKLVVSLYLKIKSIRRNKVALQKSKVVFLLPIFVLITLFAINAVPKSTYAATNSDINFQARLENSSGAIVPDGWYNVEFKLYSASSGGSAEWTEDYTYSNGSSNCTGAPNGTGDCRVQVYNGYLTVSLGSITNFPNTINWDQQQWLTMNIGGTAGSGTITWDGEMSPRLQVTSVPYAFRAGQLAYENGSSQESTLSWYSPSSAYSLYLPNENGTLCVEGSTNCNFAPTTGGTGYIQNQNSSPQSGANFNIGGSGIIGSTLTTPALQSAASTALTITGNAASTWSTSAGNLSIQAAGTNTLSLDTTGAGTVSIANNATTIDVGSNNTSAETINVGGSGSNTINIGNTQTAGSINLGSALTTGYISIGGTGNQTGSISLGTGSGTQSISLGTGSGAKTLTVGSTNSSSTLSLQGGATTEELTNSGETLTSSNSTSAFQVTGGSNNVFSVSTNTTTPQAVLGTNANLAGSLLFNTTSSGDPITLQATSDSTTGGYVLSLPTTAPSAGLCLQTSSSYTASTGQLVFGLCSNANASISEVAYSDNHGYSSVVTTVSDSALTVGDLIVVTVQVPSTSATVTSITGGNASNWNRVAYKAGNGTVHRVEMWMGTVTTTGSSTITVNSSDSLGNNDEITETEYTASGVNAGTSWGADTEGTNLSSGSTTVSYPSLEPQSEGELYEGYAQVQNPSATAGSTAGFNYQATGQGNMEVYDPDVNPISIFSPTAYQSSSGQANTVAAIFTAYISSTAINNTTVTQIGNFNVEAQSNGSTGTVAGVLQAAYGDTTDNILNFYNDSAGQSSTNQVLGITETGNLQFGGLTSQSIAVTSQVTGTQLSISAGGATSGVNVGGSLVLQGGVGANSNPSGSVIVQSNSSNSSMAFIVQNASSAKVLNVDTINNAVTVGTATVYGALGLPSSLASSENLTTGSNPFSQTTGNFCGNNRADLAVTNYTTGTISLYCNNGTTLPTTATSTLTTGTEPEGIATGNFCGNNRADLASANSNTNNISIFCNTGTGFSSTASSTLTAGTNPYGLASGNFCDNGRSDLAVTNHGTNTIFVYCNTGSALPTTVTSTLTTSSSPQIIVTANLCDSGYADIAVSSPTSNNVNIFCNTGSALPTTATSTISGGTGATIEGEATGSFCDSAYTDLAVMDYGTASTSIYCNTGSALPTTATSTLTTGNDPETAIGGNFCGNGRADLDRELC